MGESRKESSFEKEVQQLEKLLDEMENQELSLEQSIEKFEQGVKLVQKCQQTLERAEQKVKALIMENNKMEPVDYRQKKTMLKIERQPASQEAADRHDVAEVFLRRCSQRLDQRLDEDFSSRRNSPLIEAMRYACSGNAKRFRPGLVYASAEILRLPAAQVDAVACAIELIHTYSLIHDDLPAMDNDDLRRGRLTVHRAFDEARAILAGDALHDMAFELIGQSTQLSGEQKADILKILAFAAGTEGMSGGQMLDISLSDKAKVNESQIEEMHRLKTGSLMRACVHATMVCADRLEEAMREALHAYAQDIGLCFQLRDDILDTVADKRGLVRPNYALMFGMRRARQKLEKLLKNCLDYLAVFPRERHIRLKQLTEYAGRRKH